MARLRVPSCVAGLWFGNLNNGANAGLRYVNANNALSTTRWNILLRLMTKTVLERHAASEMTWEDQPWRKPKIG